MSSATSTPERVDAANSALSNTCVMTRVLGTLPYNRGARKPDVRQVMKQLPA